MSEEHEDRIEDHGEITEGFVTFPAYIMGTMFKPGDKPTHLVENVLGNLWAAAECSHVFEVQFIPQTATFEAVWLGAPVEYWEAFLESHRLASAGAAEEMIHGIAEFLAATPTAEDPHDNNPDD
jgi:hypothetical protein